MTGCWLNCCLEINSISFYGINVTGAIQFIERERKQLARQQQLAETPHTEPKQPVPILV